MPTQKTHPFNWQHAIHETYQDVSNTLLNFAPEFLGALALLAVGWLVARLLRLLTKKAVRSFDSIFYKIGKSDAEKSEKIKDSYSRFIGQVAYWAVLIFFFAATANLLGWQMFANWMDALIQYLPRFIAGLLIILLGFLLSNAIHAAILRAGSNAKISQAPSLARLVQWIILFCAAVIGIEQIGLQMYFLTTTLTVIVGILLAGACLAFGLGAKTLVANTIGAQYMRKNCKVGDEINIAGCQGEIVEIQQSCVIVDTDNGQAIIPARLFQEQVCMVDMPETKQATDQPVKESKDEPT